MHIPSSTYRVQLHKGFTFKDLLGIADYLYELGISTIYAAPILRSAPGSMHGYDVIDPHTIDSEIGTLSEFRELVAKLKEKGISWLQDIVPNHMAFHARNSRLMDVLERGKDSPYYHYFDIDWNHPAQHLNRKLGVPFLGSELETCLAKGEIRLSHHESGLTVNYGETSYPLSIAAYEVVVAQDGNDFHAFISELKEKALSIRHLQEWKNYKQCRMSDLGKDQNKKDKLNQRLKEINNDPAKLRSILDQQYYTLVYWKRTEQEINYRRFFTVNELICLRMEDPGVFEEYHRFIHSLYQEGLIQGIRIDHIDGLRDPSGYIKNLRNLFGNSCYIIAEKILEAKEDMPEYWPLEGTSGYEFLSYVNQLVTDRQGASKLLNFYRDLVPNIPPYKQLVFDNKKLILENYMGGEWNNLILYFIDLKLDGEFAPERLKQALGFLLVSMPVYRIYPDRLPLKGKSLKVMQEAFDLALQTGSEYKNELEYLRKLFTEASYDQETTNRSISFLKRLMQFTGPLTAKGVEDTTFYVYNPLISHDEVGDAPSTLGISIPAFHAKMIAREKLTPLSLNASATHDTKRGEDARLRLNVLSEIPDLWIAHVQEWFEKNNHFRQVINGKQMPTVNDEYFIYQSMVGSFPEDFRITEEWITRMEQYLIKAIREAKVNSNWAEPDDEYENICLQFLRKITDPAHSFVGDFISFIEVISRYAHLYSLVQVMVKATSPGIPDTYQGCELWDLSLVDPDNRRPVDYNKRVHLLQQIRQKRDESSQALLTFLRSERTEGLEKLFVTWKVLNFRRSLPALFNNGSYIPLQVSGKNTVILAYARCLKQEWIIVVVPLALARNREQDQPYADEPENDRYIILPEDAPANWMNIFTGEELVAHGRLSVFEVFKDFPVALFRAM